jgi:putative ABC transport system permease protein
MLRANFLLTLRNQLKNPLSTIITLIGFSSGIAAAFMIFSYVSHELGYDRFHENAQNIYRVHIHLNIKDEVKEGPISPNIIGPILQEKLPEVEKYVRMYLPFQRNPNVIIGEKSFIEESFFFSDSTLFDVLTVELISGSERDLFTKREDAIISEKTALRYFNTKDVIGKTFEISNEQNFIIRGVFNDFPDNSHIKPNVIVSSLASHMVRELKWEQSNYFTYLLLTPGTDPEYINQQISQIMKSDADPDFKTFGISFTIFPLTRIHLHSKADFEPTPVGDINQIYALIMIAAFILIIACVNYVNLYTSKSLERAKEVGLRKMMGSNRKQLILQFMMESFVITFLSMVAAYVIITIIQPYVQQVIDKQFMTEEIINLKTFLIIIASWIGISIFAGIYPAFILSSYSPTSVMRGSYKKSKSGILARKSLVIFQYLISAALIVSTLVVYKQINYMSDKKLGFDKDHIVVISQYSAAPRSELNGFKNSLLEHSNIDHVSFCSAYPSKTSGGMPMNAEGMPEDEKMLVWHWQTDIQILDALGVNLIAGRNFMETDSAENVKGFIINKTTADLLDWTPDESIGKKIKMGNWKGECIGVVQDFHFSSLKDKIEPMLFDISKYNKNNIIIRFGDGDVKSTMTYLEEQWQNHISAGMLNYSFVDDSFDSLYKTEKRVGKLFAGFSVLAIIIASLGLFGLAAFETQVRTKEIGIRKVMGSSTSNILRLLLTDFITLVIIGFAISIPASVFFMNSWLKNFAYKISVNPVEFILAASIIFLIVFISVGYYTIKASIQNPVNSLRYE